MLCLQCRRENPPEAQVCSSCGTELAAADPLAPISANAAIGLSPGFVGRQREMGELVSALEDALAGRGQLVMLVGEPGIGRTRTTQELAAVAEQRPQTVVGGTDFRMALANQLRNAEEGRDVVVQAVFERPRGGPEVSCDLLHSAVSSGAACDVSAPRL